MIVLGSLCRDEGDGIIVLVLILILVLVGGLGLICVLVGVFGVRFILVMGVFWMKYGKLSIDKCICWEVLLLCVFFDVFF